MKHTFLDMVGKRYGKIVVLEVYYKPGSSRVYAKIVCDCGKVSESLAEPIKLGLKKSCGCGQKQEWRRKLKGIDVEGETKELGVSGFARKYGVSRMLVYKELKRANEGK